MAMANEKIMEKFDTLRQNLLDLTMRNQLLNFRPRKTSIRVVDEITTEIFEILVLNKKSMEFLPKKEKIQTSENSNNDQSKLDITDEESKILWELPAPDINVDKRHKDLLLQTKLASPDLQKRLFNAYQQSNTLLNEQGYNILYLAIGFLEWKESPDSIDFRQAPLLLIPVELERKRVKGSFKLKWIEEDIITNISLNAKLEEQFIDLPNFDNIETKEELYNYFKEVEKVVEHKEGWKVKNDIFLGFFSFTKFVMYNDLDPMNWPENISFSKNPIVNAIFNPSNDEFDDLGFSEYEVDTKLSSKEIFTVLDADSSQISVIEDAKFGKHLVVEGPPGTGKSQTIVNLIAELLAMDKKVLFVSEKMAALEVVKSRLDSIGLGDFCLELHSRKANKKDVLEELERTLNIKNPEYRILEAIYEELDFLKSDLNDYNESLHASLGKSEFSPFKLYGIKETAIMHFQEKDKVLPLVEIENALNYSLNDYQRALFNLQNISDILKPLAPLSTHIWRFSNPNIILPNDQKLIKMHIEGSQSVLDELLKNLNSIVQQGGIKFPENREELNKLFDYALMVNKPLVTEEELLLNSEWDYLNNDAQELMKKLEKFINLSSKFKIESLDFDISEESNIFRGKKENLFSIDSAKFYQNKDKTLTSLNNSIKSIGVFKNDLEALIKYSGIKVPKNQYELDNGLIIASKIADSPAIELNVLNNNEWNFFNADATKIIDLLKKYKSSESFLSKFKENVLDQELKNLKEVFEEQSEKSLKFLRSKYKHTKKKLLSFYVDVGPDDDEALLKDLDKLFRTQDLRNQIRESDSRAKQLFGSIWSLETTNTEELDKLAHWLVEFRTFLNQEKITENAIDIINKTPDKNQINRLVESLKNADKTFKNSINYLIEVLYLNLDYSFILSEGLFDELISNKESVEIYFEVKEQILSFYKGTRQFDDETLLNDLDDLAYAQDLRDEIRRLDSRARQLFGEMWNGETTDLDKLIKTSEWLLNFRNLLNQGKITENAINIITFNNNSDKLKTDLNYFEDNYKNFVGILKKIKDDVNLNCEEMFPDGISQTNFTYLQTTLNTFLEDLNKLPLWSQYISQKKELSKIAEPLIKLLENNELDPEDIVPALKANFADSLLRESFLNNPTLKNFAGHVHDKKINQFNEIDESVMDLNIKRINSIISNKKPKSMFSIGNSELGILKKQFSLKRRHLPIRKLLSKAGGAIQSLKPCFMMSPLSVAQFIDPASVDNLKFDVIIFDEASQLKPEDALGALLRGNQLVVMGDTKQLPPTSFFDAMIEIEEDEDEDDYLLDMESILHLCKTTFPTKMLKWHYRSRHESLIAVSNQEFYDNQLFIYPSPCHTSKKLGLHFEHVQDSIYDRGGSGLNIEEARAVVNASFEHYNEYGDKKSLGIGTFNTKQQRAIQELIELKLKQNPGMEKYFVSGKEESFFVKNLETIQGDERDVIFISIGFGFDRNHKLNQNFGPLNKNGGERRLNVLATRAKEKCVVFSNFTHSDLKITAESPFGLRALKVFLEYAKEKKLITLSGPLEDTESPFEDSVYQFLRSYGYEVHKQVGCAGYRIDLAVVDPKNPGNYLIGIECDGAMYHSSKVARDRDRLRQQVLENLGWNIYRIWSTDWYRNRKDSISNLINAINNADNPKNKEIKKEKKSKKENVSKFVNYTKEPVVDDIIVPYEICGSLGINTDSDIHEKSIQELSIAIKNIVNTEGPIHFNEVVKRFRTYWGLKRAGKRIQDTLTDTTIFADRNGDIIFKNEFLYPKNSKIVVRTRNESPKAELICEEEISEAIIITIQNQFATPQDEIVISVARMLGFKSARKPISDKVGAVIDSLVKSGKLVNSNDMINLPK
ncbi:MAG: DUF3320 domain-containing protein [Methanobacteriaceae archaeon]|nr:DUF3320 domain-containing protein [Methanobacteriaceae archaeon]